MFVAAAMDQLELNLFLASKSREASRREIEAQCEGGDHARAAKVTTRVEGLPNHSLGRAVLQIGPSL